MNEEAAKQGLRSKNYNEEEKFMQKVILSFVIAAVFIFMQSVDGFSDDSPPLGASYVMVEDNGNWSGDCRNLQGGTYRCQMEKFTSGEKTVYTAFVNRSDNQILIRRGTSLTDSNSCLYTGQLSDKHVRGTYKCKSAGNKSIDWEAFLQ